MKNNGLKEMCLFTFQGYSYVAPSIIFSENTISSNLLAATKEHQPDESLLQCTTHFKVPA